MQMDQVCKWIVITVLLISFAYQIAENIIVQEVEEKIKSRYERCYQEVMQETSDKVKSYYLKCLYQLVPHSNTRSPGDQYTVDAISHDLAHDPEAKYYPLLSGKSDRRATQRKTTRSRYNQESLRKTSNKDSAILATVSHPYKEPDTSRNPNVSLKPVFQSCLASKRLSVPRNVEIPSSSSIHKTYREGRGAERKKMDEKGAQHKTFSRTVRASSISKYVPSTKLIMHNTSPETSPATISWRVPVCSARSPSPPKGVHWKNCSRDKKPL